MERKENKHLGKSVLRHTKKSTNLHSVYQNNKKYKNHILDES